MTVLLGSPMALRDRIEAWLEDALPYLDRAKARRREEQFARQLAKSRVVRAQANIAIVESRRARRDHMRGSYQRANDRLARR